MPDEDVVCPLSLNYLPGRQPERFQYIELSPSGICRAP